MKLKTVNVGETWSMLSNSTVGRIEFIVEQIKSNGGRALVIGRTAKGWEVQVSLSVLQRGLRSARRLKDAQGRSVEHVSTTPDLTIKRVMAACETKTARVKVRPPKGLTAKERAAWLAENGAQR